MDFNQATVSDAVYTVDARNVSNGAHLKSSIEKRPESIENGNKGNKIENSNIFSIKIYKKMKIIIYKPLIPLKLALFLWYGGGGVFATFLLVFLKQRGITLTEISILYILSPIFQFIGPTLSGIIADKIGRSKPVLVVNLFFVVALLLGLWVAPSMNISCDPKPVELKCPAEEFGRLIIKTSCNVSVDIIELSSCNVICPENITQYCNGQNLICEILEESENYNNFSLSVYVKGVENFESKCYYNVVSISHKNVTYSWCDVSHKMYCRISCLTSSNEACTDDRDGRTKILILYMVLLILFFTFFSNTYRFMDVTAMSLVKDYNSDFGRERFFSVLGVLISTPLIGYIVDKTTPVGAERNYNVIFYFFIGIIFLLQIVIYKLDVRIKPPGKNMWKKSFYLLKNPDVITFALALTVLGTCWGFTKYFTPLYLQGMKAPSVLLGLLTSVNASYGLPFLFNSNWWVNKLGANQIFVLGLLGYVVCGMGYSFLYNPWLSLLIEATSIITYHLLWVAVIVHSHSIAPEGLTATVLSTTGGIHYSIGRGFGGLIGGQVMEKFGGRFAYRLLAVICLAYGIFYAIYLHVRKMYCTGSHSLDIKNREECTTYKDEGASREVYVISSNEMK